MVDSETAISSRHRATAQRVGRFEQAHGATLFLDEIGDMPAELQTRLLRVLAEGQFYRVGGHLPSKVDVRVIAATHQDLEQRVKQGVFREDLFHRLNVIRLRIPPLRERREDIGLLAQHFLATAARELDTAAVVRAKLFIDRRESTLNEAGDFLAPKKEGAIGDDHIRGEIGDLVLGRIKGRESPGEITLFKSLGIGVEDVASAHFVYHKALKSRTGVSVEFGGQRFGSDDLKDVKRPSAKAKKKTRKRAVGR